MSTEARLWLAMGLSTLVIIVYSMWMQHRLPFLAPPAGQAAVVGAAPIPAAPAPAAPVAAAKEDFRAKRRQELQAPARPAATARPPAATMPAPRATGARSLSEVVVENGTVVARFSPVGGRLVSWQLKPWLAAGTSLYEELVPLHAARTAEGPLSVVLSDDPAATVVADGIGAASAPAVPSLARLTVSAHELSQSLPGRAHEEVVVPAVAGSSAQGDVTFTSALPRGRTLVKRITLPAEGYETGIELVLTGPLPESLEIVWAPGVGLAAEEEELTHRAATYQNLVEARILSGRGLPGDRQDLLKQAPAKAAAQKEGVAPFWAAIRNKYFVAALVPPLPEACEGVTGISGVAATAGAGGGMGISLKFFLAAGATRARIPLKLYAGPQQYGLLQAAGDRLEKTMDFGFFGILALPMLKTLTLIGRFTRNYGVAIILLTLLVRGLLWFPSQWGLNQMRRLQKVKPQIDFIMQQFKNDPQRKQEEMMRIYKENQVNPVGGCLPMLLQIPVFFALYSALANSIELRGAPFALWIHDLSARDPFYVLPVLVAGSMFWQQLITPVVGDPEQAKMMKWMSLFFAVMFFKMPSGLMLYWLASNLLQIAQQYRTNQSIRMAT